jgi:signal transduction histidine kinase
MPSPTLDGLVVTDVEIDRLLRLFVNDVIVLSRFDRHDRLRGFVHLSGLIYMF